MAPFLRLPYDFLRLAVVYGLPAFLAGHVFTNYFYSCAPCVGISMLPTFQSFGDWVVVSKYHRRGRGLAVGDVVSFAHPARRDEYAIKRVVGMPGDLVLRDTPGVAAGRDAMVQVPDGHCWVVGDNLAWSRDSRMFGPLPLALIKGKVIWRWNRSDAPLCQRIGNGLLAAPTDQEEEWEK